MVVVTVFVVSLLTGGLGVYVGARLVVGSEDPVHAVVTGLLGAVVWVAGGLFLGWIPLVGPVLVFLTYVWLVARRYPGDWAAAARIAGIAWLVTAIVLSILATAGFATLKAVGFPDVSGSFPSIP